MGIFRVYWKNKNFPKSAPDAIGYIRAADEADAKRIAEENLDTRIYKVVFVSSAAEHMVTPKSITFNFCNTAEYHFG